MTAKILVVDDIPANVLVLEARLQAAYYTVVTASSGAEALEVAAAERPDLILLDVMMPGMDGFECCSLLKADPDLAMIPVVMITALDQPSDRLKGLEAGADDFLTKPPNELALFARVRSLVRVKMMIDELRLRDETHRDFGALEVEPIPSGPINDARVMIVDGRPERAQRMADALAQRIGVTATIASTGREALSASVAAPADAYVIAGRIGRRDEKPEDGLRLCTALRSQPGTRQSSLILTVDEGDHERVAEALDFGVDDYLTRPVDESELTARMRGQLRRKRYADRLRDSMRSGLRMAMTDSLTGLYNRRYADQHLSRHVAERSEQPAPAVALAVLDIDHFKAVNDTHGHAIGDEVLVEFSKRLKQELRGVDLVARYGGEEFLAALPAARIDDAVRAADRVRQSVERAPFETSAGPLSITVSVGVAAMEQGESAPSLLRRADAALYSAKRGGRNRVSPADPADTQAPSAWGAVRRRQEATAH